MITYTTNEYGMREKDMAFMHQLFMQNAAIEKVILFGSRATNMHETGLDIDLAIQGIGVTSSDISRIHFVLENDSPTLLWFDVLHYDTLKDENLKQRIDTQGKVIFERNAAT